MHRLLLLFALMPLALAAAGCGGASHRAAEHSQRANNRYVDALNRAQRDFVARVDALSSAVTAQTTPARARVGLRRFDGAVTSTVVALEGIAAPARVVALHRLLITEMRQLSGALRGALRGLRWATPTRLPAVRRRLVRATRGTGARIDATIAAINRELA